MSPSGVAEGSMALIWLSRTKSGMAESSVVPLRRLIDTPASCFPSGKLETCSGVTGPRSRPKMLKIEPCAIPPPGSEFTVKLAAFTTPPRKMKGVCWPRTGNAAANRDNTKDDFILHGSPTLSQQPHIHKLSLIH